jgi:hypothetical protein
MGLFTEVHIILILAVGVFALWLVNKLIEPVGMSRLLKVIVLLLCALAILQRTVFLNFE